MGEWQKAGENVVSGSDVDLAGNHQSEALRRNTYRYLTTPTKQLEDRKDAENTLYTPVL
jgi:hypothetical protein